MNHAFFLDLLLLLAVWFSQPVFAGSDVKVKEPSASADLVLCNAQIFTMNAARTWADGVAVSGGRIVYVGSDAGLGEFIGAKTKVVDLKGRMVLPGFVDSHAHPLSGGESLLRCDVSKSNSASQVLATMRAYLKEHPLAPGEWFKASGWQLPMWAGANPLKSDLDKIISDNPAYIESSDHHSAWVNSLALRESKIDQHTADPLNGRIERNSSTGQPSGTLRESAMQMVASHIPHDTFEERIVFLQRGLHEANAFGITSLLDARVTKSTLELYRHLQEKGLLTARIRAALYVEPHKGTDQVSDLVKLRAEYNSGLLQASTAKIFVDGVIETKTAALLQPYLIDRAHKGTLNFQPELLNSLVARLDAEGFQIHMHTIGDRAVKEGLNAISFAESENGFHDLRHQLAHLELVDPKDISRFVTLRAVANFEPYWFFRDPFVVDLTEPVLGSERSSRLYPIGSLIKAGAVVTAGSDWPVTTLNPLEGIEVAVRRIKPGSNSSAKSWLPNQCVDLADAIAAYTINGAFANHQDKVSGSIEVGKCADLIVLDKNLFSIAPAEIHTTKVLWTLLAGKEVFRDPSWQENQE